MNDKDRAAYDAMMTMATILSWLSEPSWQPELAKLYDQIEEFGHLSKTEEVSDD